MFARQALRAYSTSRFFKTSLAEASPTLAKYTFGDQKSSFHYEQLEAVLWKAANEKRFSEQEQFYANMELDQRVIIGHHTREVLAGHHPSIVIQACVEIENAIQDFQKVGPPRAKQTICVHCNHEILD